MKLFLMIATTIVFAGAARADEPSPTPAPAAIHASICQATPVACASVDCLVIDDEIAYDDD